MAVLFAMAGSAFVAYRYWTRPVALTAAVTASNIEDIRLLNAFARVFATNKLGVTLKVETHPSRDEVAKAFLARKADVAVLRADAELRGEASVIAVIRKSAAVVLSLDPKIDDVSKLKGKRVGVLSVAGSADSLFAALLRAYDMTEADVQRVDLDPDGASRAAEQKRVDVIVSEAPLLFGRLNESLRAVAKQSKLKPKLLPIGRDEDVIRISPAFEAFDIPERAFGPLPEEEVKSVAMATNLVAQSKMPNEIAATLARQFLSNRQAVLADAPSAAQIAAPATEKDAFVRVHPGVAAYIDNEELTFFDKYGDLMYILMAVGGVFGSGFVALRRSFGPDLDADAYDLVEHLVELRQDARKLALAPGGEAAANWLDLSARFETMLQEALPLIADSSVSDRTVQALSTALASTERAIADVAPIALRRAPGASAGERG